MLKMMTSAQIKAIAEFFHNVRHRCVTLEKDDLKRLLRRKRVIRRLVTKSATQAERRQIIVNNWTIISYILKKYLNHLPILR